MEEHMGWFFKSAEELNEKGLEQFRLGRYSKAIEYFNKAINKSPSTPAYHWHLGFAQLLAGQHQVGLTNIYNAANMGCPEALKFIEELEAARQESGQDDEDGEFWVEFLGDLAKGFVKGFLLGLGASMLEE
jgi:tetratricopeptide (TPR) repeat protein